MAEITAAIDEQAANTLFDQLLGLIPPLTDSGSGSLGPFVGSYDVSVTFSGGNVDLIPPGTIRINDFRANWHVDLEFGIDLNKILPRLCLPQVCIDIPCVGEVCTPEICIDWPSITVPVSLGDFLEVSADFGLLAVLNGPNWEVKVVVQQILKTQFGPTTAGLLAVIGLAITPILLLIPFIGPILAVAVNLILAAIGIAGLLGFLGPIISPFVQGLEFKVYDQNATFRVLPADGPFDPQVNVHLDKVDAQVTGAGEDELVVSVDISA